MHVLNAPGAAAGRDERVVLLVLVEADLALPDFLLFRGVFGLLVVQRDAFDEAGQYISLLLLNVVLRVALALLDGVLLKFRRDHEVLDEQVRVAELDQVVLPERKSLHARGRNIKIRYC